MERDGACRPEDKAKGLTTICRRTSSEPSLWQVATSRRVHFAFPRANAEVAGRIRWQPDPRIQKIVAGWPARIDARRARELGFKADADMIEIIDAHIEDELGGLLA